MSIKSGHRIEQPGSEFSNSVISTHNDRGREQDEVIAFLSDPNSYPTGCKSVERINTHGAIVFLAGQDVYKIKRNVRYSYMDYSTLEKRRQACQREIEINKPQAPQIYHGAVPITRRRDGELQIGGNERPVEWTVHMNRFDQSNLLSAIVERGELDDAFINAIATEIADYHAKSPKKLSNDAGDRMGRVVSEIESAFGDGGSCWPAAKCEFLRHRLREVWQQNYELLNQRGQTGFVRRVHGDLHLSNIVAIDGQPVLFDAIEFDEKLATTDILYDLAFVLMDLDVHGAHQQSCLLLNRYLLAANQDSNLDALCALPLFFSLRASIRSMVAMQRANLTAGDARQSGLNQADQYFNQAISYLEQKPPRLVAVGGFSGTGKSTLAAKLAAGVGNAPGAIHIRSDVERKLMFGIGETQRLPDTAYTEEVGHKVYMNIFAKAQRILATGHSVIIDAVFAKQSERDDVAKLAEEFDAAFTGVWLTAPRETLHERVKARRGDASDATEDVVDLQLAGSTGKIDWHYVDASGTASETLGTAQKHVCRLSL